MADNKMQNKIILDRAKAAALSHDYTLSARLFKGLLSSDPENVEFLQGLGDVYEKSGQDASAIPLYREVIRLEPSNVNALNRLAGIYRRLKRYDDSISMLEQALITDESNVQVYYNLGFTYKLMGKYDDAVECFDRVIEQNPSDVLTYNHLGSIYDAKAEYAKAVSAYQRGLKVDPNHPVLHLNLAHAYESLDQLDLAEKEYDAALRTKPGWLEAIDGYAALLLRKDDAKNAGAIVRQAISLNPQNVKLHSTMGDVYSGQHLYTEAEGEYKEALKYDGNYAAALSGLANAYEATGRKEEALRTVQKLEKAMPESESAWQQYSYHLLSSNKLNAASRKIKQLWDRNPDDVRTLNLLAQYYICKGEDSKAQGCFKKIEALNPQYTAHLVDAGDRYHQKGRYKKAEDYYLRYLESNTNDSSSMLKLAKNYEKLGLYDKALAYYQMLSARDAANPVYTQNVSRVSTLCSSPAASRLPVQEEPDLPEEETVLSPSADVPADIDDDIAPVVDDADDDAQDFEPSVNLSGLEEDIASARDVIDSDALDEDLDIDDSRGVDLDSLVPDHDGLDDAEDFFADNPFGASDASLPSHEEDMGDIFQDEQIDGDAEDSFVPPPVRTAPPKPKPAPEPEPEEEPDAFEDDLSFDSLDAAPEPEDDLTFETLAVVPADSDMPPEPVTELSEEELVEPEADAEPVAEETAEHEAETEPNLDAEPESEPAADELPEPDVDPEPIEEEQFDPMPADDDELSAGVPSELDAEPDLEAESEPAADELPEPDVEPEPIEEELFDPMPADDDELPAGVPPEPDAETESEPAEDELPPQVSDADLYGQTSEQGAPVSGEAEATLSLLNKLKSLIPYLPEDKQDEFSMSHARLLMDYLIARLSGKEGLLSISSKLREELGIPRAPAAGSGESLVASVVSGMGSYVASMPDETLARTLEGELFSLMQKLERTPPTA